MKYIYISAHQLTKCPTCSRHQRVEQEGADGELLLRALSRQQCVYCGQTMLADHTLGDKKLGDKKLGDETRVAAPRLRSKLIFAGLMSLSLLSGCGGAAKQKPDDHQSPSAAEKDDPESPRDDQPVVKQAESEPAMLLYGGPPTQDEDKRDELKGPDDPVIGF